MTREFKEGDRVYVRNDVRGIATVVYVENAPVCGDKMCRECSVRQECWLQFDSMDFNALAFSSAEYLQLHTPPNDVTIEAIPKPGNLQ